MSVKRAKKLVHLNKISELKSTHNSVVTISHLRLSNEQLNRFRDEMFEKGNKILFIKNTIANLSFKDDSFSNSLEKSNFLIFGNDIFSLLKDSQNFIKSLRLSPDTKLSVMAGFLDNGFLNQDEIKSLEKIPSKESLYVGILNTVLYPMRTLVRLLDTHVKNNNGYDNSSSS